MEDRGSGSDGTCAGAHVTFNVVCNAIGLHTCTRKAGAAKLSLPLAACTSDAAAAKTAWYSASEFLQRFMYTWPSLSTRTTLQTAPRLQARELLINSVTALWSVCAQLRYVQDASCRSSSHQNTSNCAAAKLRVRAHLTSCKKASEAHPSPSSTLPTRRNPGMRCRRSALTVASDSE